MTPVVCSVGCTEPWNVAGLGLDVRALAACGVRPVSVVAGVTAQDRRGLHAAAAIDPALIAAQFAALAEAGVAAYRVGALLDAASVAAVATHLGAAGRPSVYDPVLAPSGAGTFADAATRDAIVARLLPVASLITPNLAEAAALAALPRPEDAAGMERCARALVAAGARAVLVTGGHLAGDPLDVFADRSGLQRFTAPRLPGELRGTGCLLACGIAAALARGAGIEAAIARGRAFVRERFVASVAVAGMRAGY